MHIAILGPANIDEFSDFLEQIDEFPKGFGGTPVNELVKSLLFKGHKVTLITLSSGITDLWKAEGNQLTAIAVPNRLRVRTKAKDLFKTERKLMADELRKTNADVVHAHWTYEFALAALDAKADPLLITAHDAPVTILKHFKNKYRLVRLFMAYRVRLKTRHLSAVSPYLASRWRTEMFYKKDIKVIPNIKPSLNLNHERLGMNREEPIILEISDGSSRKNVWALIEAFQIVKKSKPASKLLLAGHGLGYADEIAKRAKHEQLDSGIQFMGHLDRESLSRVLGSADIFCHVSKEESQGLVFLEAMEAGLSIIGGKYSGGVSWTVFYGKAGLLVDVTKPDEIARAINEIIEGKETIAPGFDLQKELDSRYSAESVSDLYIQKYQKLIDAKK